METIYSVLVWVIVACHVVSSQGACNLPVGFEDGSLPDSALSASSQINRFHGPSQGRLNNYRTKTGVGAWCANKNDDVADRFIEIDLGSVRNIEKIATQGRNATYNQYVETYRVTFSSGGIFFTTIRVLNYEVEFTGNTDQNTIVYNDLPRTNHPPIRARYIRIHPVNYKGNMCMRIELYECVADIDECSLGTDQCEQSCSNTDGSYTCSCYQGYRLKSDGKRCQDIDECSAGTDQCQQGCTNTAGSYTCYCHQGYRIKSDEKGCQDINECTENTAKCHSSSTNCVNKDGSYTCTCLSGYKLSSNPYACQDIDECSAATDQCEQSCSNTIGSYTCSCYQGYSLQSDGKRCQDVNECSVGNHKCDVKTTTCVNSEGSYTCSCRTGYQYESAYKCKAPACDPDVSEPLGMESGKISSASITASSHYVGFEPWNARLNARRGKAWYAFPSDTRPWIQVFIGNTDPYKVVTHQLLIPVYGRYVRLYPLSSNHGVALKLELYGCTPP